MPEQRHSIAVRIGDMTRLWSGVYTDLAHAARDLALWERVRPDLTFVLSSWEVKA